MDMDAATIWSAAQSKLALRRAKDLGIGESLFRGPAKAAWEFLVSYEKEHGDVPGVAIIVEHSGMAVKPPEEDEQVHLSYLADQLFRRHQFRCLQHGLSRSSEEMDNGNIEDAVEEVGNLHEALTKAQIQHVTASTIAEVAPEVQQLYEQTKRGEIGVPFPWEAMNDMTLGLWPGTLTFFVARPGLGKTWSAIIIAMHAWKEADLKVLVVSPEMNRVELGERIVSKYGELSYGDMVGATLGTFQEKKLAEVVEELKGNGQNFYILDDEDRLQPEYIEQAIDAIGPDLVVVDSVYMMRVQEGKVSKGPGSKGGRYDRIHDTVDWMRRLSRRKQVPVIGVSQLSRDGKVRKSDTRNLKSGKGTGGLEDTLAMTDTLLWDVHNLFAIWQDPDMKVDGQLMFVPLKVRRQARSCHVVINWDLVRMNFEQIGTRVESSGGDDDSGGSDRGMGGGGNRYKPRDFQDHDDTDDMPF